MKYSEERLQSWTAPLSNTEKQRSEIASRASGYGFHTLFFDNIQDAMPLAPDAEIFFGSAPEFTRKAAGLRWVCAPSAGVNQYLAPGALPNDNVILSNSSGAYGVTISEHIVMVTLEIMRRQQDYREIVAQRKWVRNLPIRSIRDCRITLLGTGDIGREAAFRLRAFSPTCLIGVNRGGSNPGNLFDRIVLQQDLETILPETDLLIISLPGTGEIMVFSHYCHIRTEVSILIRHARGSSPTTAVFAADLLSGLISDIYCGHFTVKKSFCQLIPARLKKH